MHNALMLLGEEVPASPKTAKKSRKDAAAAATGKKSGSKAKKAAAQPKQAERSQSAAHRVRECPCLLLAESIRRLRLKQLVHADDCKPGHRQQSAAVLRMCKCSANKTSHAVQSSGRQVSRR